MRSILATLLLPVAFLFTQLAAAAGDVQIETWENFYPQDEPGVITQGSLPYVFGGVGQPATSVRLTFTYTAPATGRYYFWFNSSDGMYAYFDSFGNNGQWGYSGGKPIKDIYLNAGEEYFVRIDAHTEAGDESTVTVSVNVPDDGLGYAAIDNDNISSPYAKFVLPSSSEVNPVTVYGYGSNGSSFDVDGGTFFSLDETTFAYDLPLDAALSIYDDGALVEQSTISWDAIAVSGQRTVRPGDSLKLSIPAGHFLVGDGYTSATVVEEGGHYIVSFDTPGHYQFVEQDANSSQVDILEVDVVSVTTSDIYARQDQSQVTGFISEFDSRDQLKLNNLDQGVVRTAFSADVDNGLKFTARAWGNVFGRGTAYVYIEETGALVDTVGLTSYKLEANMIRTEDLLAFDTLANPPTVTPYESGMFYSITPSLPAGTLLGLDMHSGNTISELGGDFDLRNLYDGVKVDAALEGSSVAYAHFVSTSATNPKTCHSVYIALPEKIVFDADTNELVVSTLTGTELPDFITETGTLTGFDAQLFEQMGYPIASSLNGSNAPDPRSWLIGGGIAVGGGLLLWWAKYHFCMRNCRIEGGSESACEDECD